MKLIEELEGLVSSKWGVITSLISLMKLEARLAGLSIAPLLLNLFVLFIVLITVWFTAMAMLGYGVFHLYGSGMIAISSVLLINIVALTILIKCLSLNLKKMSFEKTRNYFSSNQEPDDHEQKAADVRDSSDGRNLAVSPETSN